MESITTLYRIDFFNKQTCQVQTKFVPADSFKQVFDRANHLKTLHKEFGKIKQIAELHPISIIYDDDRADNENL